MLSQKCSIMRSITPNPRQLRSTFQFPKAISIFRIRDHGIGIFRNLEKTFKLQSELEAYEWLLKKENRPPFRNAIVGREFSSHQKLQINFSYEAIILNSLLITTPRTFFWVTNLISTGTEVQFTLRKQSPKESFGPFSKVFGKGICF